MYIPSSIRVAPKTQHNTIFMGIQLSPSVCNTVHWNSQVGLYVMDASAYTSGKSAISLWLYEKMKDCLYMKACFFLWRSQYVSCNNKMTSSSKPTVINSRNSNPNANRSNRFVSEWKKAVCFCFTCRIVAYLCLNNLMVNGAINSMWPSEAMKRHRSKWTLTQLIEALSHQLNQWWLINNRVLWHSP